MSSEMRSRKPEQKESGQGASAYEDKAQSYINALNELAPSSAKKYVSIAAPYVITCVRGVEMLTPYLITAYGSMMQHAALLEKYNLQLLTPALIGLIMCFFGGRFMTLIAACEAYRMIGLDSQLKFVKDLKADFAKFLEANKDDDVEDLDNDGIADVKQIDKAQLVQRKGLLFLKTVDPVRIGDALGGLQSGLLAVVATLKMQFCKAITLGTALGEIVLKPVLKYVLPLLEGVLPDEYKKWGKPLLAYSVKCAAVSFAWFVQRIISAFHSAMRGGHLFSQNILEYLDHMGYYKVDVKATQLDEVLGYAFGGLGLVYQLSSGFGMPWPLRLLMWPFSFLEWWLMWLLNISK